MKRFPFRGALILLVIAVAGCGYTIGGAPRLLAPADGAILGCAAAGTNYLFTWGAAVNAVTYVLEVYRISTNTLVASATVAAPAQTVGLASTALTCGGVNPAYRWRVGATLTAVNPTPAWSGYWTFTIP